MISSEESNKGGSSPSVAESSLEMTENTFKPAKNTKKCYIILHIGQSASGTVRRSMGRWMALSKGWDSISEWSKNHGGMRIKSEPSIRAEIDGRG